MDLDEIKVEPSSNLCHEKTPVGGASSVPCHEKTPVGGAAPVPQDKSRGLNEMTPEKLDLLKNQVCEYARKDRWKEAEWIFNKYGEMVRIPMTGQDTALHVAVSANSINFVKGLVNLMNPKDMEIRNWYEETAFNMAATLGNRDIVQIMIKRNQNLHLIRSNEQLPVHGAACNRHHKIVQDLSSKTLLQKMDIEDIQKLFFLTIEYDMFGVATKLFGEYPDALAISREYDVTALEKLLPNPSKELRATKRGVSWGDRLQLLQKIWLQLIKQLTWREISEWIDLSLLVSKMADALESGNVEAVQWLLLKNPELLSSWDIGTQRIFHIAVRCRHHSIVSLIFKMQPPDDVLEAVDDDGNNILHCAAHPMEIEENSSSLTAATKMKNEVAWFKEKEKNFPSKLKTMINKEGKTPKDVFLDKHKDLSREVKDTAKAIADSGMLVAALVAAVAFAAALTVPGDKTNPSFTIFILASAAALFTSSASILSFLSNFTTSRFADSEFVIALHPSLILGPILLLISIVTMVISFAAASFLIFEHTSKWAAYVVTSMGVFPVLIFLIFQFKVFDAHLWTRFYRMP